MQNPYTPVQGDEPAASPGQLLRTPLTDLLRIKHPVLLAGMGNVATSKLVAAVSNAGGLGCLGGVFFTPESLRKELAKLKEDLHDKTAFGVDLLLPQIGGSARKTNHDYTKGKLPELIDVIIESKARLFVSAVGVPPRWAVDKLHSAGILVMNMCGHPHHVEKALAVGVDVICCQGTEGGGHTGEIGTLALIPMCMDKVKGRTSELHGGPIHIVAAGGIYDGRGMAASLALGAEAVWVGTRFVASTEATALKGHKENIIKASPTDTIRTLIYTGRPLRVYKSPYVMDWENNKQERIRDLTSKGKLPVAVDQAETKKAGKPWSVPKTYPHLMGQAAGGITEVKSAAAIVHDMTSEAAAILRNRATLVAKM